MFTIIDINKIKHENCGNEFNNDSITTENYKVDNPNETETKHSQKPEVVGEILVKESNEMQCINIFDDIKNNKTQQENLIKEEVLDDEIKSEFDDDIVKEESQDNNYEFINVKSEFYNDASLNGTDNDEESTSKISPESTNKQSHECNDCHKSFKCNTHLRLCNTGEKPFKYDLCDKALSLTNNLVESKYSTTVKKPYKCDVCNKMFRYCSTLVTHKYSHSGEKPYKCDVCDRTFSQSSSLVAHKRCHTGEKPFKCDVCDKTFNQTSTLVKHKRCHTGERPYKCDVCDKTFSQRTSIVAHKRCHTGEKPYKCDICDKTFSHSSNFVRHKRRHTEDKTETKYLV